MKRLIMLAICSVVGVCTGAEEQRDRNYYLKLHSDACDQYENGQYEQGVSKWREVYQWAHTRTNDCLRYKSLGNIVRHKVDYCVRSDTVVQRLYDIVMAEIEILLQLRDANIATVELSAEEKRRMLSFAEEAKSSMLSLKGKIVSPPNARKESTKEVDIPPKYNPYELPMPLGMFRGLATVAMSPCDIFMAWPASVEMGHDIWVCFVPVGGSIIACGYVVKDIGVGLADFLTLGWVGNRLYDDNTSPWWWQRFSGKRKADVFR